MGFCLQYFSPWNFASRRKKVKEAQNFTHFTKENSSKAVGKKCHFAG